MRSLFLSTLLILSFVLAGCVINDSAGSYLPRSATKHDYASPAAVALRAEAFHECLKEAQQTHSSGGIFIGGGGGYGSTNTKVKTNHQLLCSCMNSEGYRLREADAEAILIGTVLLPLALLQMERFGCTSMPSGVGHADIHSMGRMRDATAQVNLGLTYYRGEGVAQDYAEAVKWFRKAEEQGDAKAQVLLGLMYADGEGVAEDDAEAVKWFRKSAEQGFAKAQLLLGWSYATGHGVAEDYVLAHMWLNLGRAQGEEDGNELLAQLVNEMTREQIAQAQKMAREWQEQHTESSD